MSQLIVQEDNRTVFSSQNYSAAMKMAETLARSDLAPRDYKGKPENILLAMQLGYEIGLQPMQAIQNIAVIGGRPCLWGDAMLGLCQDHPEFEWVEEKKLVNKEGKLDGYSCKVKRKNYPEHETVFTIEDATLAGLWKKSGPWSQYPSRMLQMRARGFALRNTFPDALKGLISREEAQDHPSNNTPAPEVVTNRINNLLENKVETMIETVEVQDQEDTDKFVERRKKIFDRFESLLIQKTKIFAFFEKGSIEDFDEKDLKLLTNVGMAVSTGIIPVPQAFSVTDDLSFEERIQDLMRKIGF